jgi:hypothetical protein
VLDSKFPKNPENIPDYGTIRTWVIESIESKPKPLGKPCIFIRRDLAMLAGLCVAPEKASPGRWPKVSLAVAHKI